MADNDEWIDAHAAAAILKVTERQVYNHANAKPPRIQSKRAGWRVLYEKADVERLAIELGSNERPRPRTPAKAEMIPMSQVLGYIQQIQDKLNISMLEIGRLQAQLENQRLLSQNASELQEKLTAAEARIDELRQQLDFERLRNKPDNTQ